jgi:hypothetical protein
LAAGHLERFKTNPPPQASYFSADFLCILFIPSLHLSVTMSQNNDLAYGRYYESDRGSGEGSRGLSDTFKKLKDTYKSHSKPSGQGYGQGGAQGVSVIVPIVS